MRYWLVWLVVLIASLGLFLPPVSGEGLGLPLKWNVVETPGRRGCIIMVDSEVSRIAVGRGGVVYAIDSRKGGMYRSENGGSTWVEITVSLVAAGADLPAQEVAVCPEKPTIVAVVDKDRKKVYVSKDSGATWDDTVFPVSPTAEIQCLALSPYRMSGDEMICDIAVGTKDGGNGRIYARSTSAFSSWQDQGLNQGDIWAVKFSPTYSLQATIVAVSANAVDTLLSIGKRDLANNSTNWNAFAGLPGYPVVVEDGGDSPDKDQILGADLDMPVDFNLFQPCVYVSTDSAAGVQVGIYRIEGVMPTVTHFSGSYGRICSLSHYGKKQQGRLVAGEVPGAGFRVKVWWTDSAYPGYGLSPSLKDATQPPTGPGNAFVRWSYDGTVAYCGTSGTSANDESAFSVSYDFGNTWQQLSLIDTIINISDIAPAPDSKSLFLASYTEFGPEGVWRSAGEPLGQYWGRVLSMETATDRLILRLSPYYLDDYTIYAVEAGDAGSQYNKMAVSYTRGNTWYHRPVPGPVIDFAVEDKDTIYVALPGGHVRKDTSGGATWISPEITCFPLGVHEINMLSISIPGHVLVGSRDGRVAYSNDGGNSFTQIEPAVGNDPSLVGDVQVVADARYKENGVIYASDNISDKGIWRWTIGTSWEWEQIDRVVSDLGAGRQVVGLAMGREGTLYAASSENVTGYSGGMSRSLNPSHGELTQIEWDIVNRTLPIGAAFNPLVVFDHNLPHLKISDEGGRNILWAVDTANHLIYAFEDNICRQGPLSLPTGEVGCDPASGRAKEVNFCWEQLSLADGYDIEVAKDGGFSIKVLDWTGEHAWDGFLFPVDVTRPCAFIPAGGALSGGSEIAHWGNLECGHTYYWRVRVRHAATTETIRSPWSEVKSFTVKAGVPVVAFYQGVQPLAPRNGVVGCPVFSLSFSWAPLPDVTKYEFVLAEDADFTRIISSVATKGTGYTYEGWLKFETVYFWRVRPIEVNGQASPSDWSPVFCFQTETLELPAVVPSMPSGVPFWALVVIALGCLLIAVTVSLLFLC